MRFLISVVLSLLSVMCAAQKFDSTNRIRAKEPDTKEIEWLRSVIIPLKTVDMNSSEEDLAPLKDLTMNAKIVALGEVTHGSSEIYRMKDRIIKYLVEKEGFTIFSIEGCLAEAYRINKYIKDGQGDPKELIKGMQFWTWDTQEMLELVEWMRAYNKTAVNKITFTGFDMQCYEESLKNIIQVAAKYPAKDIDDSLRVLGTRLLAKSYHDSLLFAIDKLDRKIEKFDKGKKRTELVTDTLGSLKTKKDKIRELIHTADSTDPIPVTYFEYVFPMLYEYAITYIKDSSDRNWFMQNKIVLEQYSHYVHDSIWNGDRDRWMAENLLRIQKTNPQARIIVWAHNGHIQSKASRMGYYVSRELKQDYLTIAFSFHEGTFSAYGKNGHSTYKAQTSYPGTFEYYFHVCGQPIFLLDLRKIKKDNPSSRWLFHESKNRFDNTKENSDLKFRVTGAVPLSEEFYPENIMSIYDMVIFIDKSTGSTSLHKW